MRWRSTGALILVWLAGLAWSQAECPPPESIMAVMAELDTRTTYRAQEFELEPPRELYEKAAKRPGQVVIDRNGKLGQAVVVYELPVELLWMAINDEDHYAEGGYLPVEHSEVIDGVSRGERRILFQYFKRSGFGRWWIDEVVMNRELFEESDGQLWELRWWDLMEEYAEKGMPKEHGHLRLSPIRESRGAWLMVPLADSCTLIEYVTISNPGGFLSLAQVLAAGHVIRENLEGVQRLAVEHVSEPHPGAYFTRPDGTVIDKGEIP